MSTQLVDSLSRRVAGVSRRGSLKTLGMAGLAALAHPLTADARKKSGNKEKRKRNTQKEQCPGQVAPCTAFITALCNGDPDCLGQTTCCAFLERCDITTFLTCTSGTAS